MIQAIVGIGILLGLTTSISSLALGYPIPFAVLMYVCASILGASLTVGYLFLKSYICADNQLPSSE